MTSAMAGKRLSPEAAELLRASIDRQVETAKKDFTIGLSQFHTLFDKSVWTDGDNSSRPTRPYGQVELVFRCVEELVNAVAALPLVLSTVDEKIIESGPQYDVLFRNPLMSFKQFIIQTVGHWALSRDVFWVFTDMVGDRPREIAVVSGTQMHPITDNRRSDGRLIGWEFRGSAGQRAKYAVGEVYQIKNFNPYDRFHGIGPASAAKLSINYSYAASLFNTSALDNAAEPGLILTAAGNLQPEQLDLLRRQFEARHRGAARAKRTAVLTGGMDVKTVAMNMSDLQLAKISQMKDRLICSAFGVPPEIVGLGTEAQYAQGPAQRAFVFNTVMPLGNLIAEEITSGILSRFYTTDARAVELCKASLYGGMRSRPLSSRACWRSARTRAAAAGRRVFAWFDYDQHPVVQETQREVAEKVFKFTASGVPLNNLLEAHDLPYKSQPWGDDWWINMGLVPARYALEAGVEGITGPSLPEGQQSGEAGYEPALTVKPYPNEHSARLRDPKDFNPETFRRTNGGVIYGRIRVPKTIAIIWGKLKDHDSPEDPPIPQALRFPTKNWSVEAAKKWLKDNEIKYILFEPAESSKHEKADSDELRRLRVWRNWVVSWASLERRYAEAMRKYFLRQQRLILAALKKALGKSTKADADEVIARVQFDLARENGKLKVINNTFFEKSSELGIRQALSEVLGRPQAELAELIEQARQMPLVRAALLRSSAKITNVNATTQRMVAAQLTEGLENGESLNDLVARVRKVLGSNRARALSIARTQTAGAVSTGRHAGNKTAGVTLKTWLTSRDANVRDSHVAAEAAHADGIPIDKPFVVGGAFLMYPGDPAGPPAEIINCRCVELAKAAGAASFDLNHYANLKFFSLYEMEDTDARND